MHADLRRLRPAELLALASGLLLAVSLFLPWYAFPGGRRDAFDALTVAELPAAIAAALALTLVVATVFQRSPAIPVALATFLVGIGLLAVVLVAGRAIALPGAASERCYGLWLGLTGTVGVTISGLLALRDESPFWRLPAAG